MQHEVLQRQVDARGEKGGRQHEAADLDVEVGLVPWVAVHEDAANVADSFAAAAHGCGDGEGAQAVFEAEVDLEERANGEDGKEDCIAGEGGVVAVDGGSDGAGGGDGVAEAGVFRHGGGLEGCGVGCCCWCVSSGLGLGELRI